MSETAAQCLGCLFIFGVLLTVILVPLSFSYINFYEFGLIRIKPTGKVLTDEVFTRGRYFHGITKGFIKYQADAHIEELGALSVFSTGETNSSIGLALEIDVDFTYFIKENEVGDLHQELASSYRSVVLSRTKDAIKNEAAHITFREYTQERKIVEQRFREAIQFRWEIQPSVHCELDQFHLGRIRIPDAVANKQLESRIQTEANDREDFLQAAVQEREATAVEVNSIFLEQDNILRTAEAEASLRRARAKAEATRLVTQAQINGTKLLFEAVGIDSQDHKTAFTYIRTLTNRENIDMKVSYLGPDSVLRTTTA